MSNVKVSIVVDDEHAKKAKLSRVVAALKRSGLHVHEILDAAGVVTGSVDEKKVASLRKLAGVANVELAGTVGIAPPESDVQ
jgi:hypothetical protein